MGETMNSANEGAMMNSNTGIAINYRDLEFFIHLVGVSIRDRYGKSFEEIAHSALSEIGDIRLNSFLGKFKKKGNPNIAIKNLMHSWYTESCLNFPSIKSFFETAPYMKELFKYFDQKRVNKLFSDISVKFGSWNYIKMYYGIYFSLSSMLRCIISVKSTRSHRGNVNNFCNIFLGRKFPSKFLCYPFNVHSTIKNLKDDRILEYIISNKRLIKNKQKISLIDFFYFWRIFMNYFDLYKFLGFRDTKYKHKKYKAIFDLNLKRILFLFNMVSEVFFTKCYGYEILNENFRRFRNMMRRSKLTTYPISVRFGIYDELLKEEAGFFG